MDCTTDIAPQNSFDGRHNNVQFDRFLAGMESNHDNRKGDREFSWTYCRFYSDTIQTYIALPETAYQQQWQRDCAAENTGDAALIGAISYHDNHHEDRRWTFYCGHLKSGYETYECGWSNYVNQFDEDVSGKCPNDGIMRGISSYYDVGYEDRRWRFECCRVRSTATNPAQMNAKEADDNDHVIMTPESQNRTLITIVSISAGSFMFCLIFGIYLCKKRQKAGLIYEHAAKSQDEDMDENMDENIGMGTCVDGDIDGNDCNLDLEKVDLKVIDEYR